MPNVVNFVALIYINYNIIDYSRKVCYNVL